MIGEIVLKSWFAKGTVANFFAANGNNVEAKELNNDPHINIINIMFNLISTLKNGSKHVS